MAKKTSPTPAATPGFSFEPDRYYRVVFTRPVGIASGQVLRPGVEHKVIGERLPPFAEFIKSAEAI